MLITILCIAFHHPPIRANYNTHLNFFIFGQQNVNLYIKSRTQADITLRGIIDSKDTIGYKIDPHGSIHFEITPSLQKVLDRYHVKISDAVYEPDYAKISIMIKPIHFKKKVILKRKYYETTHNDFFSLIF